MARVRWAAANAGFLVAWPDARGHHPLLVTFASTLKMHEKPHNVLAGTPAYSRRAPQ